MRSFATVAKDTRQSSRASRARNFLQDADVAGKLLQQLRVQIGFQFERPFAARQNLVLQNFQLLRDKTLPRRQRLLADIILRHLILKGIGNFDVITEYAVVTHFEIFDSRALPLADLHVGDKIFSVAADFVQFVQLPAVTGADISPVLHERGRRIDDRRGKSIRQRLHVGKAVGNVRKDTGGKARQLKTDGGKRVQGGGERHAVARHKIAVGDFARQPLDILDPAERIREPHAHNGSVEQFGHPLLSVPDFIQIPERRQDHAVHEPRAHARPRLVEQPEE